nr:FxSxx-COOH cyclophane-containing RiPP peptide [uncultured Actinoplanes sp.]
MDDDTPEWQSPMPDLSDMSLEEIIERRDDSALSLVLRRLQADLDDPDEPIAGFNSAL